MPLTVCSHKTKKQVDSSLTPYRNPDESHAEGFPHNGEVECVFNQHKLSPSRESTAALFSGCQKGLKIFLGGEQDSSVVGAPDA